MRRRELVEARFRWTKEYLEAFEGEVRSYLDSKPYSVEVHVNRERTEYTFRIRIRESPPDHWPFVISDIVHNLRSTLDNLAFNLAGSPPGKRGESIQFPIIHPGRKGGRPVFDKVAKRELAGVHPDAIGIIEGVQPYHGLRGARPPYRSPGPWPPYILSVLNHMSNVDKHRSPHIGFFAAREVAIRSAVPPVEFISHGGRFLEDKTVLARCRFAQPNVQVNRPSITHELALKIPWRWGRYKTLPLADYLTWMVGLVERDILTPLRPYMK